MKTLACITARMMSERLPGKVMADICGKPVLERVVSRYKQVKLVDHLVVATSVDSSDECIAKWCDDNGVQCFRGSLDDVCRRVYDAMYPFEPQYVIRGLADAPFIEPRLTDMSIRTVSAHKADAARICAGSNTQPVYGAAEFPYSWEAVEALDQFSRDVEREHFGMYVDNSREVFNVIYLRPPGLYYSTYFRPYRLELDTEVDLELIRVIYERLGAEREPALHEVITLLDSDPDLAVLNSHVSEKTGPLTTFSSELRQKWAQWMLTDSVDWAGDWAWLAGRDEDSKNKAIWCNSGTCYLGCVVAVKENRQWREFLVRPDKSVVRGGAFLSCPCGAGLRWYGG